MELRRRPSEGRAVLKVWPRSASVHEVTALPECDCVTFNGCRRKNASLCSGETRRAAANKEAAAVGGGFELQRKVASGRLAGFKMRTQTHAPYSTS